ncbi:MAG: Holliday junction branch migration protein RuvA [Flavobacteriales bacterium]|jgi:Holliday junction DNA helicase RuvA|nr:Holliday junction branch migration protein RuvA [Flavobacteriales bacterium]MDG1798690.1 Holliday junction branch migration protein RuvA [Flavobacteriales bacterium]|tara:strand:- start:1438 stop:2019 length:582 start_codon:yes stop_codon:yes gene_type:complete
MIAHIEGILESKTTSSVVIDVNGVGYMLNISLNTFESLPSKGKLRLYSHLTVREDAHILFGFAHEEERLMFKELINVSGVGASTALMILSSMKPSEVVTAVGQSDVNAFKSVKGIGLKSAQRIIVDLKGKLDKIETNNEFLSSEGNTYKNEALSALTVLGIDKKKASNTIDEIMKNNEISSVEELIKKTLKAV